MQARHHDERKLYLDFDGYFAAVEEQAAPALHGRPVAVLPYEGARTCVISANAAAKRYGVGTGTGVDEARRRCPGIALVGQRPDLRAGARRIAMKYGLAMMLGMVAAAGANALESGTETFDPFEYEGHATALSERESGHTEFEHEGTVWSLTNWGKDSWDNPGVKYTHGTITASAEVGQWRVHLGHDEGGKPYGFVNSNKSEVGSTKFEMGWECGREKNNGWKVGVDDPKVHGDTDHYVGLETGSVVTIRIDGQEPMRAIAKQRATHTGAGAIDTLMETPADMTNQMKGGMRATLEGTVTFQEWKGTWEDRDIQVLERVQGKWEHGLQGSAKALAAAEAHCAREGIGPRQVRQKVCAEEREDFVASTKTTLAAVDRWRGEAQDALGREDYEAFEEAAASQCFVAAMGVRLLQVETEKESKCRSVKETEDYIQTVNALYPVMMWCEKFELLPGARLGKTFGE